MAEPSDSELMEALAAYESVGVMRAESTTYGPADPGGGLSRARSEVHQSSSSLQNAELDDLATESDLLQLLDLEMAAVQRTSHELAKDVADLLLPACAVICHCQ